MFQLWAIIPLKHLLLIASISRSAAFFRMLAEEHQSTIEPTDNLTREFYEIADNKLDRATRQAGDLAERYLDADLNLVVRIGDASRQHVAVVRRLRSIDGVQFCGQRTETIKSDPSGYFRKNEQPLMLANIVQTIKGNQELIPSIAWLEVFDRRLISSRKPLYAFVSPALPFGVCFADRKVSVFYQTLAVSLGQCGCQQIETGSDTVDNGPNLCVDEAGKRLARINLQNLISSLRIFLGARQVWGFLKPSFDACSKAVELGFGPFNAGVSV
jgi:hypothetical protein